MTSCSAYSLLRCQRMILTSFSFARRTYAKKDGSSVSMIGGALKKKKMGKLGPMVEKKVLPVETDSEKLVKLVCGSNIYKTGQDVEIKPDSEYPEWLWSLRTGPPLPLEELDPNSKEYWKRVRKMAIRHQNQLSKSKRL